MALSVTPRRRNGLPSGKWMASSSRSTYEVRIGEFLFYFAHRLVDDQIVLLPWVLDEDGNERTDVLPGGRA
jgi:hypothetical protein